MIVTGRVEIPKELIEIAKSGLLKKREWRRVLQYVERGAMASGGVLEQNLQKVQAEPLAPSTLKRKREQGLPATPLIGKKQRIKRAVSGPTSTFRHRSVQLRKKGGVVFRVGFKASKFPTGKKDPYTKVLQSGRLHSMETKSGKVLDREESIARSKARDTADIKKVNRMPGRPIMSYHPGNEAKLTPALLKGVYQVLREKGLSE